VPNAARAAATSACGRTGDIPIYQPTKLELVIISKITASNSVFAV